MDPQTQFCHNPACPARGQAGQGHIKILSQQEQRYQCKRCDQTFSATKGTPFYRLHQAHDLLVVVVTLLSHGCPRQAITAAFGLDERTVAAWQAKAGAHAQPVHGHLVQAGQVDRQHVQADELWVKLVGRHVWLAMAMAVPSRLWLGGVVSSTRDRTLIGTLVQGVCACASSLGFLVCVDGLRSYVTAFRQACRAPVHTGRRGRPRLVAAAGFLLGQVVKRSVPRRVVGVTTRVVHGSLEAITAVLQATDGGTQINTAFSERLNATCRGTLVALVRRGRALARTEATLTVGMWLVGTTYHCCWLHASLRMAAPAGTGRRWLERTPAMAAGLTDHPWTMAEWLHYQIPLPAWVAPKRRGRAPKPIASPTTAVAA